MQPLLGLLGPGGGGPDPGQSDPEDVVLIAPLAGEPRCHEPERASVVWARLRHLGARRS